MKAVFRFFGIVLHNILVFCRGCETVVIFGVGAFASGPDGSDRVIKGLVRSDAGVM